MYFLAEASHPYDAEMEKELSFSKGDFIVVRKVSQTGWSEGECNGKGGWFPSGYVEKRQRIPSSTWLEKFTRFSSLCCSFFALSPVFGFALHHSKKMNKRNVEDGGIDGDGTSCLLSQNEKKKNVSSLLSDSKFTCVKPKD